MFSTSVGRVVRSTCAACSQPTLLTARSIAAASKPLAQRSHQRRQSSSKASIPPDGARRSTPSTQQTSNSSARVGRRKSKHVSSTTAPVEKQNQTFAKQYPNLPRVESTSHLLPKDVNISSFFSLHRPISVTHSVPPPATQISFSSIFESRQTQNKRQDVIITLSSFVENLEQQQSPSEDAWQTNDQGAKQLDDTIPPSISLDNLVARFQPFKPPPAPSPFPQNGSPAGPSQEKASTKAANGKTSTRGRKPKPRTSTWKTTIIVTEYTNPSDGSKVCHVATAPLTRIPNAAPTAVIEAPRTDRETEATRQPFLRRMWLRRVAWEDFRQSRLEGRFDIREPRLSDAMHAISVKRQRKLKMKKHKYKKLMRRTRNLRRKLGKL